MDAINKYFKFIRKKSMKRRKTRLDYTEYF